MVFDGSDQFWFGSAVGVSTAVDGLRSYSYEPKKCTRSRTIGPPSVKPACWSEYGSTTFLTGSAALSLSLRKNPKADPCRSLVPERDTACTCTPVERPWVMSYMLVTTWNSAIASRLILGCPKPEPEMRCEICWPSRLSWN